MELNIIDTVGDPLSVMRVMIIEGDKDKDDKANLIFAQEEPTVEAKEKLEARLVKYGYYKSTDFISKDRIFSVKGLDLQPQTGQKYTVVLWIEGCDEQCSDERLGDRVKMQMDIYGI